MTMTQFRTARNRAQNALLQDRKAGEKLWTCCGMACDDAPAMYRHIVAAHEDDLQHQTKVQLASMQSRVVAQEEDKEAEFKSRRAEKYGSDPISLTCSCDPTQGTVILFYTYIPISDPLSLAKLHKSWSSELDLCGKVKVAKEGINATLAGSSASITAYIDNLTKLPDFQSLQLSQSVYDQTGTASDNLEQKRFNFFKPTGGCRHVFGAVISIKVVDEICPLGAPDLRVYDDPDNKRCKLPPREFHQRLKEVEGRDDVVVLDVRNYYESSIGRFPGAITPPIRKFSSFRDYVDRNKDQFSGKTVLSYCTGGIRCEKATSYLRQSLESEENSQPSEILMLEGGIHNYLEWIKQEGSIAESLWLGKNYVFDARQALGLEDSTSTNADHKGDRLISFCRGCEKACARYVKCDGFGCHRLIIACIDCSPVTIGGESGKYCCEECHEMGEKVRAYVVSGEQSAPGSIRIKRGICSCERERRIALGIIE